MTQPSQVFPPWLTPSVSAVTNSAGVPVATETTIVYLPLTYFGPSVPLGSLWTFGGSTSPASTSVASTPLTTTAIPSLTTTATPTTPTTSLSNSASISISNTATPISSITPTSTSSSLSLTSATTSSSIPSPSSSAQISALTRGQLVGVIVASILGLIFLFVLALFLFLWCKGRRNGRFRTLAPLDEDGGYDVLSASDVEGYRPGDIKNGSERHRAPGEGSPRQSGDEASSFLRQSHAGGPSFAGTSAAGATAMSQVPTELGVSHAIPGIPPPTNNSKSSGTLSSYSHASGFGVVIERPNSGLGQLPSLSENPQRRGLSAADLHRLDQENENDTPYDPDMYENGEYTGAYAYATDSLLAPPRLLNPDYSPLNAEFPSQMSDLSDAEVLTAERRRIGSLILPRTSPEIPGLPDFGESSPRSSGLLEAIGLGGLANLGRRSWFRNLDSQRYSPDFTIEPFTEKDLEMGQGMLSPDSIVVDSRGRRVGAGPDGTRPMSSSSARSGTSGGTIYHDAQSSTPGTPLLPSLPRAVTPTPVPVSSPGNQHATEHLSPLSGLPAFNDEDTVQSPGNTDNLNLHLLNFDPNAADILDMPAPAALHHFSSVSSLKDTTTGGSFGLKPLFPPGLDTIKPVGWSDVATEVTDSSPSMSSIGGAFLNNSLSSSGRITIDLLEDAPPGAELGWRSIASAGFGDAGRRGTFGLLIDQSGFTSEQGSLHSMRSHFNPSVRSTGSAAASRRDGSGSISSAASSRPSAHSIARTGSISSDGRRRHHTNSPTLSAFGYSQKRPSPLSNNNDFDEPSSKIPFNIGSPPCAHVTPDKASTIRSLGSSGGSGSVAVTVMNDNSFGTVKGLSPMGLVRSGSTSQMSSASFPLNTPWATGLDNDWVPSA